MKKFYISLQTPEVEIPVKSYKDAAGFIETIFVTFKRYGSQEADVKLQEFREITNRKLSDEDLVKIPVEELGKAFSDFELEKAKDLKAFIKTQVIAIRQFPLFIHEEGKKPEKMVITDTRTVKKNEELWGEPEDCLNFLLDILLDSNPWSSALTKGMNEVFYNIQLTEEASIKN
jgi:hypothetical protein